MMLLSAICVQKPRLAFQHAKLAFKKQLIQSGLTYSIARPERISSRVTPGNHSNALMGRHVILEILEAYSHRSTRTAKQPRAAVPLRVALGRRAA